MGLNINKVAVLGAGVMGASIAAHIVGAGIPVCLLDIVPPNGLTDEENAKGLTIDSIEYRNRFAIAGKNKVTNPKFHAIYDKELGSMIEVGNLTDNLDMLKECDWVVEVVLENVEVKQNLLKKIEKYIKSDAIVTSNTSGVSITEIVKDMPLDFQKRFFGTHFFNPPRYMKLFEMIPTEKTAPEIMDVIAVFATECLGKGVVYAKDTPNFIANRIGCHAGLVVTHLTEKYGYSVSKADTITGEVLGRPRNATFKTSDIVGMDILVNVSNNVLQKSKDEKEIADYTIPDYMLELYKKGWLGDKTGGAFYKKEKSPTGIKRMFWDYKERQYVEMTRETIPAVDEAIKAKGVAGKIKAMISGTTEENKFAWEAVKANILYSARKIPEITNNYVEIDNGMKWGFNWELGPFEVWDAIGVEESVARMKQEGEVIPQWIEDRIAQGKVKFYDSNVAEVPFIKLGSPKYEIIKKNDGAFLKNIGDGIVCLEFNTKGNTVTDDVVEMIYEAVEEVEKGDYRGLVIANQTKNFSAGANLVQIGQFTKEKAWDQLGEMVNKFQYANLALKYCKKPVVTAAHGMTLGGGAEIALHGYRQVANAETYMGLVEMGVGLIPGGGGSKELLWREMEGLGKISMAERVNHVKKVWEIITTAKVSSSAHDAKKIGFLKESDLINMNFDYQVKDAKVIAISLSEVGFRPNMKKDIIATGRTGRAALQLQIEYMAGGNFISEYDAFLADKVAFILTGGNVLPGTVVSEDYILGLEKEQFLSLCGEQKTQERMQHMLIKGKPLRN